jgi:hypothetical protein
MGIVLLLLLQASPPPLEMKLEHVQKIWDRDPHSAFTDLIRCNDRFVCVFRVGKQHVSSDGALQLLESKDGKTWSSLRRITTTRADLRDPKLLVNSKGFLIVLAAAAIPQPSQTKHLTYVWEEDGKSWSGGKPAVNEPDSWIWRATTYQGRFYGWGYGTNQERFVRLYSSGEYLFFEPVTDNLLTDRGYPNEAAMVIHDDKAICLLRRDGKPPANTALLGTATAPFKEWTWRDLGVQIGGPALLRLPTGELLATVRLYTPKLRTAVCLLDPAFAKLQELLTLPSGGDCSYAGMVWHEDRLWISYYSSHEGKSAIYLAKLRVQKP